MPQGAYAPDIIVVLTDGVSNAGPLPARRGAAGRRSRACGSTRSASGRPTAARSTLPARRSSSVGSRRVGGPGGGRGRRGQGGFRRGIDEQTLKQVADLTGGTYYPAESADQLERVFDNLPTSLITSHEVVEIGVDLRGRGAVLAALALLLGRAWRPLP